MRVVTLLYLYLSLTFFSYGDPLPILDESEYGRRSPKIWYHLYDPQLFLMYTECRPLLNRPCYSNHGYNTFSHGLDILFVEATVADGPCSILPGGPSRLIDQMYEVLHAQGHYKDGVRVTTKME